MLIAAAVMLVLWLGGLLASQTFGGALHALPVLAIAAIILHGWAWWSTRR
jgi:hypothetical protein